MKAMMLTLKSSISEIFLLFVGVSIAVIIYATSIYYVEVLETENNFQNIPQAIWWAIITMTTVGYGDFYPVSAAGYIIGTLCALSGLLLLSMPIAIIANNFNIFSQGIGAREQRSQRQELLKKVMKPNFSSSDQQYSSNKYDDHNEPNLNRKPPHYLNKFKSNGSCYTDRDELNGSTNKSFNVRYRHNSLQNVPGVNLRGTRRRRSSEGDVFLKKTNRKKMSIPTPTLKPAYSDSLSPVYETNISLRGSLSDSYDSDNLDNFLQIQKHDLEHNIPSAAPRSKRSRSNTNMDSINTEQLNHPYVFSHRARTHYDKGERRLHSARTFTKEEFDVAWESKSRQNLTPSHLSQKRMKMIQKKKERLNYSPQRFDRVDQDKPTHGHKFDEHGEKRRKRKYRHRRKTWGSLSKLIPYGGRPWSPARDNSMECKSQDYGQKFVGDHNDSNTQMCGPIHDLDINEDRSKHFGATDSSIK